MKNKPIKFGEVLRTHTDDYCWIESNPLMQLIVKHKMQMLQAAINGYSQYRIELEDSSLEDYTENQILEAINWSRLVFSLNLEVVSDTSTTDHIIVRW